MYMYLCYRLLVQSALTIHKYMNVMRASKLKIGTIPRGWAFLCHTCFSKAKEDEQRRRGNAVEARAARGAKRGVRRLFHPYARRP